MTIPSWDELFMRHVYLISSKSRDTRTKIGAVLVREKRVLSAGFNGMPMGVDDSVSSRYERPVKFAVFEHGERNSIYTCARFGIQTFGAVMFTNGIPCSDCARAVIQAGIIEVVTHKQWGDRYNNQGSAWVETCKFSKEMFSEAGVKWRILDLELGVKTLSNGVVIEV